MKRRLLWSEASEAGELSTVSQPLSCSSSDILQEGNRRGRILRITVVAAADADRAKHICEICLNRLFEPYLLGCLQGDVLDWAEAEELVLSVLSGLLREQTLSMLTVL